MTTDEKKPAYSVHLPKTAFGMKLTPARVAELQALWQNGLYKKLMLLRAGAPLFVLHDGPPYLSAPYIHIGTTLNKVLKDFLVKWEWLNGMCAPFVPGFDGHGLPLELKAKEKAGRRDLSPREVRRLSHELALENLAGQVGQFQRLGIVADWDNPYVTIQPPFEAAELRVLAKMVAAGAIYRGVKPVHWCPNCVTALAEAEVEPPAEDFRCDAIHVEFEVAEEAKAQLPDFVPQGAKTSFIIWTTTPWSMPANTALAVNKKLDYDFIETKDKGVYVVASALRDAFVSTVKLGEFTLLGTVKGATLEHIETRHPWEDRASPVVLSDHVLPTMGTGVVHIAPGLGSDDYYIGVNYGLPMLCPLDARGVLTEEAGQFAGLRFEKAEQPIIEHLRERGKLVYVEKIKHDYPHCWRCHKKLIERTTPQWFCSVEAVKEDAVRALKPVEFIPSGGRTRLKNMIVERKDWCISRQRPWGVPIPAFHCEDCEEVLLTAETVEKVAQVFQREGSNSWFEDENGAEYFLGAGCACESCGSAKLRKETDTLDVWFDSGSSQSAMLAMYPELGGVPFDVYLEGGDQHRGWFNSSLLASVFANGCAPYKTVVTHGFVLDEKGFPMSKSRGNVINPDAVIEQHNVDVLRLWVASVDYTKDVRLGKDILKNVAEVHSRLRNTMRYLLSNLGDFDPATDRVPVEKVSGLDALILHRLNKLVGETRAAFESKEFAKFYHAVQNFCSVNLSSFYFDTIKDRLYTHGKDSLSRRSAQTVLEHVLQVLVRSLTPVVPHMTEDAWQNMPEALKPGKEESVLLTTFNLDTAPFANADLEDHWKDLLKVRQVVLKALEPVRGEKKIGDARDAQVTLAFDDEALAQKVRAFETGLTGLILTSQATVVEHADLESGRGEVLGGASEDGIHVKVFKAAGTKCVRCRKFTLNVGGDERFTDICVPCVEALDSEQTK